MKKRLPKLITSSLFVLMGSALLLPVSAKEIPSKELNEEWSFYGNGKRQMNFGVFHMKEGPGSKGVSLVSPDGYEGDVTVSYELMPMSAASVCVLILSAGDTEETCELNVPEDNDGSIGVWFNDSSTYFFAFHNEAHSAAPFVHRTPISEYGNLTRVSDNYMEAGNFYKIEASRKGNKLTLKIDGELIFETEDPNPKAGGHVVFRLRGLIDEPASCLIRKVNIE